jgi:hypothetical protein
MTDYPSGWRHAQPPRYPHGPVVPGPAAQPPWPAPMRHAVFLMYAGAAAGLATGVVRGLTMNLATSIVLTSPTTGTTHPATSLPAGIVEGAVVGGLWLWMARKTGAGRNWARVLSSVFFGFASLQLIGAIEAAARPGSSVAALVVFLAEWAVGLAAVTQLWHRESSQFFTLARQPR